jgi:AcrR family transcriptional regulator
MAIAPLPDPADPRPLRADARRNRARIVKAARAVFAEQGREAQMDDVARKAKVGVGTLYRHFPTKEALIEALAADKFDRLAHEAREALELADPWTGFEQLMWRAAEQVAGDRGLYEVFTLDSCLMERTAQSRQDLKESVAELIRRAQADGTLRADAQPGDVGMIMCSIGGAMQGCAAGDDWKRFLRFVLDGLRL